jgi:heptosyltransferase II
MPFSALIVKLAAIGDVAMALPMVTALREQHPGARITWLCGEPAQPLLACVAGIDRIVVADERALLAGSRSAQVAATMGAWKHLRGASFDLVITAHGDPRYRLLTQFVRAKERRSLADPTGRARMVPGRYHGDEYLRLVTGADDYQARRFPLPAITAPLSAQLRAALSDGNPGRRPLIALAPGGAKNAARESPLRRWPLASYAELARLLESRGFAIALVGSDGDAWTRDAFAPGSVIDMIGRTTLPELIAVMRECAAVVAHDSGPLHLARLAGTRLVALFGPTDPASFVGERQGVKVLWPGAELPCSPCYDGREFADCSNNLCMQRIAPDDALQAVIDLAGPTA